MRYKKKSKHIELIRKVNKFTLYIAFASRIACANINCNHFSFIFINYETRIIQAEDGMKKKAIHASK